MYRPRLPSLRSGLLRKGSLSPHQHPNSETVEDVLMEEKESVALHHHRIHQAPPPLQQETRTSQMKIRQPLKDVSALDPNADALLKNIIQNQKIPAPIKRSMLGKKPKARNQDVITKDSETLSPPTKKATNSSAADALKKHELMQKQIQEVKRERARKAAEQAKARKLEEESKRARLSQLDSYCKSQRKIQLERLAQKKIAEQAPRIAVEKCQNEPDSTAVPHVTLVHDPTFESLPDNAPDFSTGPVIIPVTNTLETVQERQLISLDENSSIEMIIEPPAKKAEIDSADLLKALRDVRQKSRSDLNKPNLDFERMTRAAQRAEWLRSRFEALAASRNSDLDTDYTDVSTTADGLTHFTENVSILSDAQVPMERPEVLSLALQESHTAVPPSLEAPVFEDKGADVIPLTDHQTKEDTSEWDMIMEITPAQDSIPAPVGVPKDDVSYTSAVDDSEVPGNFEDLQTKECSQTGLIIEIEKSNMESLEVIIVDDPLKASIGVGSIHGFDRRLKELVLKQKAASKIQKWFKRAISVKKSDAWRNHPDKDAVCSRLTRVLFQPDRVLKESNAVEMDMFTQTHPQKDSTSLKRDSSYLVLPKNEKFGLLVPQKDEFCVMKIFERNFVAGRDVPTPSEKGSIQDLMDVSESELKSEKKHNGVPRKSHSEKDEKRATAIFKPLFPATSQLPVKLDDHALGVEEISDNSFVSDGPSADSSIMSELADSCKKDLERPAVPYSPSDTPDLSEGSLSATENVVGNRIF